ncbi:hypothetical protein RFH39_08690 [Acinetobacter baumannii]|nr:hypothetical protein [Acinetobacter baumannii]MDQ8918338.1 hypothetical protein [Acinetobacter baumannii]MDQ8949292.1 hypothetical protein [Acinetobacter baumannii]MDQ8963460.1 hypothetical protein [Acinetobacter baumannii]MDQ8988307.1 hypothetical protein [Acinetobacter baumannii]
MDLTQLISMLSRESLFFCRSDLFEDKFEGSNSEVNIEIRKQIFEKFGESDIRQELKKEMHDQIKACTYICCWHLNDFESAAMWKIYGKTNSGIAIETDYSTLVRLLPENIHAGLIKYIDYNCERINDNNLFSFFMHKRKSFIHEQEVRLIFTDTTNLEQGSNYQDNAKGKEITIDLNEMIKTIHVAPTAEEWIYEAIKDVVKKYRIKAEVKQSELYSKQLY